MEEVIAAITVGVLAGVVAFIKKVRKPKQKKQRNLFKDIAKKKLV